FLADRDLYLAYQRPQPVPRPLRQRFAPGAPDDSRPRAGVRAAPRGARIDSRRAHPSAPDSAGRGPGPRRRTGAFARGERTAACRHARDERAGDSDIGGNTDYAAGWRLG